ncbi:hypothetical protein EVAR_29178_1 [Eumeta japonica]|uniref:Uncharacterized protein n=1 Tax=Eumeta variegata TaxID=151549 RepID=A0A4C1VAC8_EUMVA|nr:hypothetical protein EVAR_29178_1 [Eumeta japonica]
MNEERDWNQNEEQYRYQKARPRSKARPDPIDLDRAGPPWTLIHHYRGTRVSDNERDADKWSLSRVALRDTKRVDDGLVISTCIKKRAKYVSDHAQCRVL